MQLHVQQTTSNCKEVNNFPCLYSRVAGRYTGWLIGWCAGGRREKRQARTEHTSRDVCLRRTDGQSRLAPAAARIRRRVWANYFYEHSNYWSLVSICFTMSLEPASSFTASTSFHRWLFTFSFYFRHFHCLCSISSFVIHNFLSLSLPA